MLSPSVNTDIKMSKRMLEALTLHEAACVWQKIDSVSEDAVRAFIAAEFDAQLAAGFRPEFLFSSQAT